MRLWNESHLEPTNYLYAQPLSILCTSQGAYNHQHPFATKRNVTWLLKKLEITSLTHNHMFC
jgi:hypothetical protein